MKVLLINPPLYRLKGIRKSYYPIGLGYLGSYLKKTGLDVKLYQAENPRENLAKMAIKNKNQVMLKMYNNYLQALQKDDHFVWQEIYKTIVEEQPDVVGISCMTVNLPAVIKIANIAKKAKDCKVVVGGQHPTLLPDDVLNKESIDFAISGEGEETFLELCQLLSKQQDNFENILGLSFKKDGKIIHNSCRPLLEDINKLPFPLREGLLYPEAFYPSDLGVVITSRGCPYKCTFCSAHSIWTRRVRYRSVENVMEELRILVNKYKLKEIFFWDDSFSVDRKRIAKLCQSIREEKLKISWACTTRLDLLDKDILKEMKEAGCSQIDVGIESGSEPILKSIKKGISLEQINQGLELIEKNNIFATAFFMIGFPQETVEDIRMTFQLMQKIKATITFSVFTPYPGTEIYKEMEKLNLVKDIKDWSEISHHSPNNYFTPNITPEEFHNLVMEGSKIVDEHNNQFIFKLKYLKNNLSFYIKNPNMFWHKVRKYI